MIWLLLERYKKIQEEKEQLLTRVHEKEKTAGNLEQELRNRLREQTLIFEKRVAELRSSYQHWAAEQLEQFKNTETNRIRQEAHELAQKEAVLLLDQWKTTNEASIRKDAILRSRSVSLGKITEHLVPFHSSFPFNPKDARFIGSPIDIIVFDGLAEKKDKIALYIIEIKTGNSRLSGIQYKIKEAVLNGDVHWLEINPADQNITLPLAGQFLPNTEEDL